MASLKDVANLAGVSPSTVSYVINWKKKVRPETLERIQNAAKAVNYKPNEIARSLKLKTSRSIGLMVADLSNVFYPEILAGIESTLADAGYSSIVTNSRNNAETELENLDDLRNRNIDGVIVLGTGVNSFDRFVEDYPAPIIFMDRLVDKGHYSVSVDHVEGGYLGAKHLLGRGKKRICFIGFHNQVSYHDRYIGCLKAYAECGIDHINNFYYTETDISPEGGYASVMELHKSGKLMEFEAIFAGTDYVGLGVLKALDELGIKVPDDMSVIGYDNLSMSRFMNPALTTINQPQYEMGCKAAQMMLSILANKKVEPVILLHPELVVRASG